MGGSAWRLRVDRDRCIGSAVCVGSAPEWLALRDGRAAPLVASVAPADRVLDIADSCPVNAISVVDADGRAVEAD